MNTPFFSRILRYFLLLLLSAVSFRTSAAGKLDGLWKGGLKMPGGELEVIFRLVGLADGTYFATMDVPLQKVSRMAVKAELHGDTVTLDAAEAGSRFVGRLDAEGKAIVGTWSQPGFNVPLTLKFTAPPVVPANAKVRLTPPYREEEVNYTNVAVDQRLSGMLTIPAGPGPFPAVVLMSDEGAQDRDGTMGDFRVMGTLADYLTRRGIAVLRFDDRGIAGSAGDYNQTKLEDLVTDVQAGVNFLRTRPEIDFSHIGVIGHGEGGSVALLTASMPLPPAFVVALATPGVAGVARAIQQQQALLRARAVPSAQIEAATKQLHTMLDMIRQTTDNGQAQAIVSNMLQQANPTLAGPAVQDSASRLTSFHYRYLLSYNPVNRLQEVKCPVLLLNGAADLDVAADVNQSALSKALVGTRDVTTKKLPGVNHLLQAPRNEWVLVGGQPKPTFSPVVQETVRAWIVAHTLK